ncbi:MAG: hypothetical protein AAF844_00165 [Pseudomonadota bacterium]
MIEGKPVTNWHVDRLAATLRHEDRMEAAAMGWQDIPEAIRASIARAQRSETLTFRDDDEPLAIWGLRRIEWFDDTALIWMLSATGAWTPRTALAGVRRASLIFATLPDHIEAVETYVFAPAESTKRLLRFFGYRPTGKSPLGAEVWRTQWEW